MSEHIDRLGSIHVTELSNLDFKMLMFNEAAISVCASMSRFELSNTHNMFLQKFQNGFVVTIVK